MAKTTKHGGGTIRTFPKGRREPAPAPSDRAPSDYDGFTVDELRELLRERELPTSGNKPELIERLDAADADADSPPQE